MDVTLVEPEPPAGPTVDASAESQWARDAVLALPGPGCTATLVSPRVVLTAAHCTQPFGPSIARFTPRNSRGTPGVGTVLPGTPDGVDGTVVLCEIHPERDGACNDGVTDLGAGPHGTREHDLAVLVLDERFDDSDNSLYPVRPAQVILNDPSNIPDEWITTTVRIAGYGRVGLTDERNPMMRLFAETRVSAVYPRVFWMYDGDGDYPTSIAWAGDSGAGVFVTGDDWVEDGRPLRMLGVFYGGDGTSNYATRLTSSAEQAFISRFLGPQSRGYPGTMVPVGDGEVWTGPRDVPPLRDPERIGWTDPLSGLSADELDPDGDGLAGRHDNCWGVFNPLQRTGDVTALVSCETAAGDVIRYGCAPRPSTFPLGDTVGEISNDQDRDGVPDACDYCPSVPDAGQDDCDGDAVPGVGGGDACAPDMDGDRRPDACDNCPAAANYDQADCNFDAVFEENLRRDRNGLALIQPAGDMCDPIPCGDTRIEERRTTVGADTTVAYDALQVDPIAARIFSFTARAGFRFCRCNTERLGSFDPSSFQARRECTRVVDGVADGCEVNDLDGYDEVGRAISGPWFGLRLESAEVGSGIRDEARLRYTRSSGSFSPDMFGRWNLHGSTTPFPVPLTSEIASQCRTTPCDLTQITMSGVVWTHTPGGLSANYPDDTRRTTSHYLSDRFPAPYTFSAPPPPPCVQGATPFAGAFDWHGRIPFIGADCGHPELPIGFLIDDLFLPPLERFDIPDLDLLGQPGTWVAASEPSGLLAESGLRYVALDEGGELLRAIDQVPGGFAQRPSYCPNCPPCPNCDPIGPLAMARGVDPTATLETIPVLSATREMVWLLESGTSEVPRLLARHVDELVPREPVAVRELGRALAATYSPREDVLWVLDEQVAGHGWRPRRVARLVAVQPDSGALTVVASWPRSTSHDRYAIALEPSGSLYIVAGLGALRAHVVARVEPDLTRRRVVVRGVRAGAGAPVPGMARANAGEIVILVEQGGTQRVVEYAAADFVSGSMASCL